MTIARTRQLRRGATPRKTMAWSIKGTTPRTPKRLVAPPLKPKLVAPPLPGPSKPFSIRNPKKTIQGGRKQPVRKKIYR